MDRSKEKICSNTKCVHKGKPQPIENFYKNAGYRDNLHSWCKDCVGGNTEIRRNKRKEQKEFYKMFAV